MVYGSEMSTATFFFFVLQISYSLCASHDIQLYSAFRHTDSGIKLKFSNHILVFYFRFSLSSIHVK